MKAPSPRLGRLVEVSLCGALGLAIAQPAFAQDSQPQDSPAQNVSPPSAPPRPAADAVIAGADTKGGLATNTQIVHVTNLDDDGPGSLRAALDLKGPRVIVFDVGGAIDLKSDIKIHEPYVTIAGQTAPSPGISLWHSAVRIRTHDVVMQHIAVRSGPSDSVKINGNRDAISIDGNSASSDENHSYQVRLENVSASWSVDEAMSLWYPTTQHITVRHSIIAEALNNAGHPKGDHSMGLLIGADVQGVAITGDLLASNMFRNPVVGKGTSAFVANNYIVNPGQNAIHFYNRGSEAPTRATVVNNVVEAGPNTKKTISGVLVPMGLTGEDTTNQVFIDGNQMALGPRGQEVKTGPGLVLAPQAPVWSKDWALKPADAVKADVLRYAGARPADRDPTDRRLLAQIQEGTEKVVDSPPETGDFQAVTRHVAAVPRNPLATGSDGRTRLETWLCDQHFAVGGAPSEDCPAKR